MYAKPFLAIYLQDSFSDKVKAESFGLTAASDLPYKKEIHSADFTERQANIYKSIYEFWPQPEIPPQTRN